MTREEALVICHLLEKIERYEELYEDVEQTFKDYRVENSLKDATLNCIATALQELKNELASK